MVLPPTSSSVQTFAICNIVLFAKFAVTAHWQAMAKYDAGGRLPEDAGFGPLLGQERVDQTHGLLPQTPDSARTGKARELAVRWDRILMNDVETLPFATALFGSALLLECDGPLQVASMVLFTVSRFEFTYFYAKAKQPHRTIAHTVGVLAFVASMCGTVGKILALRGE